VDITTAHAALGALVRERREGLHISMDDLAQRARVSRSTIHRIEHGHKIRPTPAKLAQVLTVVQVTPDEVRSVIDDDEYAGDVTHWMERTNAVDLMGDTLQARPHMQTLVRRPDLIVINQETGEVAQVQAPEALAQALAAILEQSGYLVTQPR
jgi:transcriptional regulator with XRE-family HTH domain